MPLGRIGYDDGEYSIDLEPTTLPQVEIPQGLIDKYNAAMQLLREINPALCWLDNQQFYLDRPGIELRDYEIPDRNEPMPPF